MFPDIIETEILKDQLMALSMRTGISLDEVKTEEERKADIRRGINPDDDDDDKFI